MNAEKLAKIQQAVRTGGKGSVRRKKKTVHRTVAGDDKKLQATLKRLGVNNISGIEEVNLFKEDNTVIQFKSPQLKVQASIPANTYVVSGNPETKQISEILPSLLNQLGGNNVEQLKKLAEVLSSQVPSGAGAAGETAKPFDDDDVPPLVENFEEAAAK